MNTFEIYPAHHMTGKDFSDAYVISIVSPNQQWPVFASKDVLRIQFHDVDKRLQSGKNIYEPMHRDQAKGIAMFFLAHKHQATRWIACCEAGISRSPAVAIALTEFVRGEPCAEQLIERYPCFNRHVYRYVYNALHEL